MWKGHIKSIVGSVEAYLFGEVLIVAPQAFGDGFTGAYDAHGGLENEGYVVILPEVVCDVEEISGLGSWILHRLGDWEN